MHCLYPCPVPRLPSSPYNLCCVSQDLIPVFLGMELESLGILHGSPRASQSQDVLEVRAPGRGGSFQEEVCDVKKSRSYSLSEQQRRILEQY